MTSSQPRRNPTLPLCKTVACLALLGALGTAQSVRADDLNHHARGAGAPLSLSVPRDQVKYKDLGGPQLGTVWGDSANGAHHSFLRLPKGFISPAHLHTGDYYGVIVEGTVTNAEAGQPEVALTPGSYYFQRGNTEHVTKCLGDTECLIYITQARAFDFITARK